jgi:hypothetical protein
LEGFEGKLTQASYQDRTDYKKTSLFTDEFRGNAFQHNQTQHRQTANS